MMDMRVGCVFGCLFPVYMGRGVLFIYLVMLFGGNLVGFVWMAV